MRYEQLLYLSELSKYSSINEASAHLNLTQQSLSNSIKSLEDELNCTILTRTYRGISFTPEGEKVLTTAKKIIQEWNLLRVELASTKAISTPVLRILSSESVLTNKLIPFANRFMQAYPEIQLICDSDSTDRIINYFDDYLEYDLVFLTRIKKAGSKYITKIPPYTNFIPLITTKFYIVTNVNSEDASKKIITGTELKTMNLRMFADSEQLATKEQNKLLTLFAELLEIKDNLVTSSSISYCMQGVLDGHFNILISEGIASNIFSHPQTTIIPISMLNYDFQFGYLTLHNVNLATNAKKFIDLIKT